jgi:hypothetical protein
VSDLLTDKAILGIGGTLLTVGIALWRRLSTSASGESPLYVRMARLGSAVLKQQAAEGALDSVKDSLLLEREETAYLRRELREARAEIARLSDLHDLPHTSAPTESSGLPNAGSTGSRKGRTRKKPTT